MASWAVIRFAPGTKKSPSGTIYLQCHVKPGARKSREGVTEITDRAVELCVSAQARNGEANKAVVKVLSEILGLPMSELRITKGLKSRDKTLAITNKNTGDVGQFIAELQERLESSVGS